MAIPYKHHDTLRLFIEVSQYLSFSDAAEELHMTKGAISYQIKTLEAGLGFKVFCKKLTRRLTYRRGSSTPQSNAGAVSGY